MRGLPQKQNARRAYKIRLCGHLRRYKKIVKKTYIIYVNQLYKNLCYILFEQPYYKVTDLYSRYLCKVEIVLMNNTSFDFKY